MRRPKTGALGSMALASLPACCSAGAGRAGRLSPRANSCATPPGNSVESDGLFPEHTREWQALRARGHSPSPRPRHLPDRGVLTSIKFPGKARRIVVLTPIPSVGRDPNGSTPLQRHADISGQPPGIIDDFDPELVAAGTEVLRPKLIDLLWHAGQRAFPARLLLDDGAALIRAQLVRKTVHLYLGPAVGHRALDDLDRAPNALFIGNSRWLREVIEQCLFLGLGRRPL